MPGPDQVRVAEHHHQRRQGSGEGVHGRRQVADDPLVEAQPHAPGRAHPAQYGRAEQVEVAHRPPVLLVDEGGDPVGRGALGDQDRYVERAESLLVEGESGVQVLAVVEPGEAAGQVQRGAPVDGVAAAADGGVAGVPGRLDPPEEPLLGGARGALDPAHGPVGVEALRALHDADGGIGQVRHEMAQEVRPGCEVRVEDGDELGAAQGQRVVEVPGLLQVPAVGAHDVLVAVTGGQRGDFGPVGVVQDPHGQRFGGPVEGRHGAVGVVQDGQRLPAGRQVQVDAGRVRRLPCADEYLVGLPGEPALAQAVDAGERQGHDVEPEDGEEGPQGGCPQGEGEHGRRREDEGERGGDQDPAALRTEVPVELFVGRWLRKMMNSHRAPHGCARTRSRCPSLVSKV